MVRSVGVRNQGEASSELACGVLTKKHREKGPRGQQTLA